MQESKLQVKLMQPVRSASLVVTWPVVATCIMSISFTEPTCLLVSTKTRSSVIINKLVPRAFVSFAFKI